MSLLHPLNFGSLTFSLQTPMGTQPRNSTWVPRQNTSQTCQQDSFRQESRVRLSPFRAIGTNLFSHPIIPQWNRFLPKRTDLHLFRSRVPPSPPRRSRVVSKRRCGAEGRLPKPWHVLTSFVSTGGRGHVSRRGVRDGNGNGNGNARDARDARIAWSCGRRNTRRSRSRSRSGETMNQFFLLRGFVAFFQNICYALLFQLISTRPLLI